METLNEFKNLYQLSKTLRFELRPVGKTLEKIQQNELLTQDEHRAESYNEVKKIIDEYHKAYIERALSDFKLKLEDDGKADSLTEYSLYYKMGKLEESQKKTFEKIQTTLRKQIVKQLKEDECFKRIDQKELIKEDLLDFVTDEVFDKRV
ncbi:MAG: hypothetical protein PHD07_08205 [Bacteroidales bacterium]|nr:hypothetical protein [Bacteroidales bacterium]MDD3201008.1 hypothetical protein [Bacteroidales bacterium]